MGKLINDPDAAVREMLEGAVTLAESQAVLPVSENSRTVTHLVGIAMFSGPNGDRG